MAAERGMTEEVLSAVREVFQVLGYGLHIGIYQGALEVEFSQREIPFRSREEIPVKYKGKILKKKFRPDFVLYDRIILQIASEPALSQEDEERLRRLLRLCSLKHGLVVNFGATTLETRKIVL